MPIAIQRSSTLPALEFSRRSSRQVRGRQVLRQSSQSEEPPKKRSQNRRHRQFLRGSYLHMNHVEDKKLVFKVDDLTPSCVKKVLLERGWVEYVNEDVNSGDKWHLYWKSAKFKSSDYDFLLSWQVINHFPKTFNISKKDCLARNLKRMRAVYGQSLFDFFPKTFILPNDYPKLIDQYMETKQWTSYIRQRMNRSAKYSPGRRAYSLSQSRLSSAESGDSKATGGSANSAAKKRQKPKAIWIAKPATSSQGKGIVIIKDLADLRFDGSTVVQKYLQNPMLISGYKFDLRLYVVIASFHPLTVYLYKEGLVRFATEKYSTENLKNVYSHLTNTSINKSSPSYLETKEHVGPGCIWALSQLKAYFEHQSVIFTGRKNPAFAWHKITNLITLTLLGLSDHIPAQAYNCFELLGFDVLIDDNMKPWLLEVNVTPALTTDTPLDAYIKLGVVQHTVYLCEKLFFGELEEELNKATYINRDMIENKKRSQENSVAYKTTASLSSSRSFPPRYHSTGFYKPRVGVFSRSRSSKSLPTSLGDLKLIYPFNDASRLATCFERHDIRGAILEIQKRDSFVVRKLQTLSARKKPNPHKIDNLLLWHP